MKKCNLICMLIITLLALLPSNVLAVERKEFQTAITSFVKDMQKYNDRFLQADKIEDDRAIISYDNETVMSEKIGTTAMFFTDDSFVSYVFKEVSKGNMNMKDGEKIFSEYDIYNNLCHPGKTNCRYFTKAFEGEKIIYDKDAEFKVVPDLLEPGDILIDMAWTGWKIYDTYIYLGNGEFACFKGGSIVVTDAEPLKDTMYDVARISQSTLNSMPGVTSKFDAKNIEIDAATIKNALDELELEVSLENLNIVFTNKSSGNTVTPVDIAKAIRKGAITEYGSINNIEGDILLKLEFKADSGNFRTLGPEDDEITTKIRKTETSTVNKKFELFYTNRLDIDDYREYGYTNWAHEYIIQKNHSLYINIFIQPKDSAEKMRIYSIPLSNGIEKINGANEKYIECFSQLVEEAEDGTMPTLQDFLNVTLEPPEGVYQLEFNAIGDVKTLRSNRSISYEKNDRGEVLFTVNKDGTYIMTPKVKTFERDYGKIETFSLYIATVDIDGVLGRNIHDMSGAILNAGKKGEGKCPDPDCKVQEFENGLYYSSDPYITYPLKKGIIYVLDVNDYMLEPDKGLINIDNWDFEFNYLNNDLAEIYNHEVFNFKTQNFKQYHVGGRESFTIFERLEFLISFFVRNIANGLVLMLDSVLGYEDPNTQTQEKISIDAIVFDNYPLTQLTLFSGNLKAGEKTNDFIKLFVEVINNWHSNFMLIAIVAYLLILLYMAIRIVLNSTAAKQAIYKELFMHWVAGVIILFTFPYVIKYAIKINSLFVDMVEQAIVGKPDLDTSIVTGEYIAPDDSTLITDEELTSEEAKRMEKNPFGENDTGYMAVMSRRAHVTRRLSYAFVYLIMTFQLLIMAMMYYKRLFIVSFLIVLFPLVMIAHILEKVADVKTGGAFAKWTREILVNIFIQSIHAIIYSFSIATVLAAGNAENDWILMLVGVTFLFNGEEILKKILGQQAESAKSLAATATQAFAVATAVKQTTKRIGDNFIGANSHLGRTISHFSERNLYRKKAELVDVIGEKPKEYRMPDAAALEHFIPEYTEFGDVGALEVGNAIQVLNHIEYATPDQITHAMNVVETAKESGEYKELMKDLKISDSDFEALQAARNAVAEDALSGNKTKQQIDMELTMELERILPEANIDVLKNSIYSQIGRPLMNSRANSRETSKEEISAELEEAKASYEKLDRKTSNIADDKNRPDANADRELAEKAAKMLHSIYGANKNYTKDQYRMALSVAMIQDAQSGKYDAKELMTSANFIYRNQGESKEFQRMASATGCDISDFRHVLAEKISRKAYGENYRNANNGKKKQFLGEKGSRTDDARKMADAVLEEYEGENSIEEKCPQTITVSQVMQLNYNKEKHNLHNAEAKQKEEEAFIIDVKNQRKDWNTESQAILNDFSREMMAATNRVHERKIDGMTKSELMEMASVETKEGVKELTRTVATNTAAAFMAPIGAAGAIGINEDGSVISEALLGALGGAAIGDTVAETATGESYKKKVKMRNPYTGEMEEVEVTVFGTFADSELQLTSSEISSAMSSKLKEQFLQKKIARDQQFERDREAKLQNEQAKKRLEETYKRLMNKNNNNNSNT